MKKPVNSLKYGTNVRLLVYTPCNRNLNLYPPGPTCARAIGGLHAVRGGIPTKMSDFRKHKHCPSSFELAEAATGMISGKSGLRIATHLAACDFCSAELEFYRACPPVPFD